MITVVEVTLKIEVHVDAEFPPSEHAEDIIHATRRLFPAADVKVIDVQMKRDRARDLQPKLS